MSPRFSLIGRKFGRAKVIKHGPIKIVGSNPPCRKRTSVCLCDCGVIFTTLNAALVSGRTKSCGCWNRDYNRQIHTKHGKSGTREYKIWKGVAQRCNNPNNKSYKNYGGRGVRRCNRWSKFENFWKDMKKCPPGLTLERVANKTGNYEKRNCIWATRKIQSRNKRNNIIYTFKGKTACLKDLCEIFGKNYRLVYFRIKIFKWPVESAFSEPVYPRGKNFVHP